jgi:hypothetical protein
MTVTNKRLIISESHGDSNRCTPYRGKPDQHTTRFPRSVRVWSTTIRISCGSHIATFHTVVNRFKQIHCNREEGLLTQSTTRQPSDPRVRTQLLSHNSKWSSGEKSSFCWQPTTRLTGPISPTYDRYVQYLLVGANRTVLNRHRRGLQPWRWWFATYPLPNLLNQLSSLSPSGPAWSPVSSSFNH